MDILRNRSYFLFVPVGGGGGMPSEVRIGFGSSAAEVTGSCRPREMGTEHSLPMSGRAAKDNYN